MTIDTLSLAKELRTAELPAVQAEAIGKAVVKGSATKADVQLLRSDLTQAESRLEAKFEQMRSNLIMRFVATNLTMAAVIIAAVKL